jgi:hypothetical protein
MKEFTERWDIKYVSNNKIVKDFDEYKIRVIGKCNNNSIIPEESPMDYSNIGNENDMDKIHAKYIKKIHLQTKLIY